MSPKTIIVDVREDIRSGREPFSKIMKAATDVRPGDELLIIAPFEPVPLYAVLEKKGFQHSAKAMPFGVWEVRFNHKQSSPVESAPVTPPSQAEPENTEFVGVDARGLEPPQPMVKILEALATFPADGVLRARTDRRPMHLYPILEERGFVATTESNSDGSFITQIRRR